jgi:hypothetical protein
MLELEAQGIPVRVQFQPYRVKESGMPGYGRPLFRFILPGCNNGLSFYREYTA